MRGLPPCDPMEELHMFEWFLLVYEMSNIARDAGGSHYTSVATFVKLQR